MHTFIKLFLLLIFFTSSASCRSEALDVDCQFDRFLLVQQNASPQLDSYPINQRMRIVAGSTDLKTLALDGTNRATNSRSWKPLPMQGRETWETQFVGDLREVLSLSHDLGANKRPMRGTYRSTLVVPGVETTTIQIGVCTSPAIR
jgi:hypothetical protein